ncbi:MAG: hypothetical protein EAZ74_00610 [Alphaproteobacteria bacterium]|nr:MAG: hypothetical protein EAY76_01340 [Alphaproteobacteria bacterium]TAF15935.1 MAG: hypothetical protein EAZ74_00610 [Alphaproteobacteria bacterium]TAF39964.1 MAG: hypothetical protein EAZ66_03925 [Alphaproteobacteria bacterium]TAF76749.1 MAG: hypothetical protein EAZ52_03065 [Alphaproteobacteria bacterium]
MTKTNDLSVENQHYYDAIVHNPEMIHDSVAYFKAMTSPKMPTPEALLGRLTGSVAPEDFTKFCHAFADGVAYVRERFGTQPSAIILTDDPAEKGIYIHPETLAVCISRAEIKNMIEMNMSTQPKTMPFLLDFAQAATMYGVQHAYHIHMLRCDPELVKTMHDAPSVEREQVMQSVNTKIEEVVHGAMKDFGYTRTAPLLLNHMQPDLLLWAADEMKARTSAPSATISEAQPQSERVVEAVAATGKSAG